MSNCPSIGWDACFSAQEASAEYEQDALALLQEHREWMEQEQGYSVAHCDCDPSVGLPTCLYCRTVGCIERYWDVGPAPGDER